MTDEETTLFVSGNEHLSLHDRAVLLQNALLLLESKRYGNGADIHAFSSLLFLLRAHVSFIKRHLEASSPYGPDQLHILSRVEVQLQAYKRGGLAEYDRTWKAQQNFKK